VAAAAPTQPIQVVPPNSGSAESLMPTQILDP
jgi:hypothetical protein